MEQPATAPETSNAIRGAEQSGNIAKQQFVGMMEKVRRLKNILDKNIKQEGAFKSAQKLKIIPTIINFLLIFLFFL